MQLQHLSLKELGVCGDQGLAQLYVRPTSVEEVANRFKRADRHGQWPHVRGRASDGVGDAGL